MEIHSVEIEHYKNLRDCHVDFSDCGRLAVLAGVNGSGKSNFLEAVALLFQELLERDRPIANVDGARASISVSDGRYDIIRRGDDPLMVNNVVHTYSGSPSMRLVVCYSGEFNRLFDLGLESERYKLYRNDCAFVVSAKSFPVMLLTKVLMTRSYVVSECSELLSLPKATKVSFMVEKPLGAYAEPPEGEIEDILRRIHEKIRPSNIAYVEMDVDEFEDVIKAVISDFETLDAGTVYYILNELVFERGDNLQLKDIAIKFESPSGAEFTSNDLSEGEKWQAMYDTIYLCLADENTLVLLDEPDAYIHETKKRDFVRFVEEHSRRGVFTMLTTHSPNIINAVREKSLYFFVKNSDKTVSITIDTDRSLQMALLDDRMKFFSDRPILLLEGVSDLRLVSSAREYFIRHLHKYAEVCERLDFDLFSMGSADNMIDAYNAFHIAFPARRIYIVLDHDSKGKKVLKELCSKCGLFDITNGVGDKLRGDAVFLLPRPVHVDPSEDNYVIEDYLPEEYIKERLDEYLKSAKRFSKVDNYCESIKTDIRKRNNLFKERDWLGFKPLIDFLVQLPS